MKTSAIIYLFLSLFSICPRNMFWLHCCCCFLSLSWFSFRLLSLALANQLSLVDLEHITTGGPAWKCWNRHQIYNRDLPSADSCKKARMWLLFDFSWNQTSALSAIFVQLLELVPSFIPAATGAEIPSNEQQIAETGSNQCWETGTGWWNAEWVVIS